MADNIFSGLAQGFEAGARIGLAGRAQDANEQQLKLQQQLAEQEAARQRFQQGKERLTLGLSVFKDLPPASQELAYNRMIVPAAALLGYDLSDAPLNDGLKETLQNVNMLLKLNREGKLSDTDLEKGLQAESAAHIGKNKEIFQEVDKIREGVSSRIKTQTPQTSVGDTLVGPFVTHQILKKAGFSDAKIAEGQRAGKIPKNLTQRQAQLLLPRGMVLNLGAAGGAPSPDNGEQAPITGDSVSSEFGF